MANELSQNVFKLRGHFAPVRNTNLRMIRIPLELGEPQVKISKDWRLRPWVFKSAFGVYKPYLTALRIGDLILLGTPCDFSGALSGPVDTEAAKNNCTTIITSFNGHYIGYITEDKYYDSEHYETRLMNWYGPGNGAYISECLEKMAVSLSNPD
jgi:hypothetical protein